MTEKYILDTNFIFSFLDHNDSNHFRALEIYNEIFYKDLIIPKIVIAELIVSGENFDFIRIVKDLSKGKVSNIKDADLKYLTTIDKGIRQKLKAIDCILLAHCKRYRAKLITFDKRLINAYANMEYDY